MNEITGKVENGRILINLSGRIDSGNAADIEHEIMEIAQSAPADPVEIDAQELEYVSSAGLRILLRVKKAHADMTIRNVNSEVYEILDMTGFTQMMNVEKAYRMVSVDGCEVIGQGANGTIYRIDQDNVVKVYNNADALEDIQHEREVARLALVLGIPTAISYDVVRVGDSYGSVFELLNARSFSKILAQEPDQLDWCVREYVDLLKKIHSTEVPDGDLPDMRQTAISWAEFMKEYLPAAEGDKLFKLISAIPRDDHMIHGDYHTKNLELTGDEVLLIDMDTLAVGHPVFELGSMYNAFIGFSEYDHSIVKNFLGFDLETAKVFWRKTLQRYLDTTDEEHIKKIEDKARIVGYTRLIRRSIRRGGLEDSEKKAEIDLWTSNLIELLHQVDSLVFTVREIEVDALKDNLNTVTQCVESTLESADCPMKLQMQILLAVEEIFVNIANYAYEPGTGKAQMRIDVVDQDEQGGPQGKTVTITFKDQGMKYNPLAKEDPDVTLPAVKRKVGGLGVFLVKNIMDDVQYEYVNNSNILTMIKHF